MKHDALLSFLTILCCNIININSFQIITRLNNESRPASLSLSMNKKTNNENNEIINENNVIDRRDVLYKSILSNVLLTSCLSLASNSVPAATAEESSSSSSSSSSLPPITHKVSFDVRISRSDGTFYVRDDLEDTYENTVYKYSLTFGLFGTVAPNHVSKFLSYVNVTYNPLDESPLPSYSSSSFTSIDQSTGLVSGGYISGLQVNDFNGASVIKYRGRLIPATLWIEKPSSSTSSTKLSHTSPLLLTHKLLDLTPSFSITTRSNTELDNTHVVFGTILPSNNNDDEQSSSKIEFLQVLKSIPTYSLNRPTTGIISNAQTVSVGEAALASKVFTAQKDFFRGAAKSFGDTRIDNVYEGKFLRRIEVTKVGII